jgi:hypothetical protein
MLAVLPLCPIVSVQNSTIDYDLSDYKLPYLKRQLLEFEFDFSNSISNNAPQSGDDDPVEYKNKSFASTIKPIYIII